MTARTEWVHSGKIDHDSYLLITKNNAPDEIDLANNGRCFKVCSLENAQRPPNFQLMDEVLK